MVSKKFDIINTDVGGAMIVDRETFTDVAVHLKLASEALLKTARCLYLLFGYPESEENWHGILDNLLSLNAEITTIQYLCQAILEANKEESPPSSTNEPSC